MLSELQRLLIYLNKEPFTQVGPLYGSCIDGARVVYYLPISNPLPPVVTFSSDVDEDTSSLPIKSKLVDDEQ